MIEVMVSIVVTALAIFGTLGLLLNSLRLSATSNYRSIAAEQATAMAEILRANPLTLDSAVSSLDSFNSPASPAAGTEYACLTSAGCTRAAFVRNDFWLWQQQLASSLPGGQGIICRDNSGGAFTSSSAWGCDTTGPYVVKVCWNEQRISASAADLNTRGELCTWSAI